MPAPSALLWHRPTPFTICHLARTRWIHSNDKFSIFRELFSLRHPLAEPRVLLRKARRRILVVRVRFGGEILNASSDYFGRRAQFRAANLLSWAEPSLRQAVVGIVIAPSVLFQDILNEAKPPTIVWPLCRHLSITDSRAYGKNFSGCLSFPAGTSWRRTPGRAWRRPAARRACPSSASGGSPPATPCDAGRTGRSSARPARACVHLLERVGAVLQVVCLDVVGRYA